MTTTGTARMHEYRGVIIHARNVYGMYSARVPMRDGGQRVAADTLRGMFALIRDTLAADGRTQADD